MSGWNSSLTAKLSTKKKWISRGLVLGTGLLLIISGLCFNFLGGNIDGFYEIGLGAGFILVVWPVLEWVMRSKAHMGTSIDLVGMQKEDLLRLIEEYLRSRGFRYRPNQENLIIMKGEGFELLDTSLRLTVFKIKPMHLSSGPAFLIGPKASRLGIRNMDIGNHQTAIAIQIDLDRLFMEIGIKGSPPRSIPVIYRWNGKGYDTIV
jgi:hypothetical protein